MRALRSRPRERGAAALEFALVAPALILMIMGMVDFGMVMNAQAVVANGARDGARVASLGGNEVAAKKAVCNTVSALTNSDCATNPTSPTNPTITVLCYLTDTTTACTGSTYDTATKPTGAVVKVTATYTYTYITPLPSWIGIGTTAKISKVSYMRIEGT